MKSFKQFQEQTIPLILGKIGVDPSSMPNSQLAARVDQVKKAYKNKISPYTRKLKPNKTGKPES